MQHTHSQWLRITSLWSLCMCNVECHQLTRYAMYFLKTTLINTPDLELDREWQRLQPHDNRPRVQRSPVYFLQSVVCVARLRHNIFPNMEVGWAYGFGGTQKCYQRMRRVAIVSNRHLVTEQDCAWWTQKILCAKIIYPWMYLHGIYQQLKVSTPNNLQLQGRKILAFTTIMTFQPKPIICNMHESHCPLLPYTSKSSCCLIVGVTYCVSSPQDYIWAFPYVHL